MKLHVQPRATVRNDLTDYRNPPAPNVLRRGSLAADAAGQICQTGTASAGGADCQKVHGTGNFRLLQIVPKAP